jgi:hypothetical protein
VNVEKYEKLIRRTKRSTDPSGPSGPATAMISLPTQMIRIVEMLCRMSPIAEI